MVNKRVNLFIVIVFDVQTKSLIVIFFFGWIVQLLMLLFSMSTVFSSFMTRVKEQLNLLVPLVTSSSNW